jgi:hypothetical protein
MKALLATVRHLVISRRPSHGRFLVAGLLAILLSGCAENFKIVQFGITTIVNGWYIMPAARDARTQIEAAVIEAARTQISAEVDYCDIVPIINDGLLKYVDVVEKRSDDYDWLAERAITRYIVREGKIAAKTETSIEIFPGAEFERLVLYDATLAHTMDPIVHYEKRGQSLTLASRPDTSCSAIVRIYQEGQQDMRPKAQKLVNFCGLQKLQEQSRVAGLQNLPEESQKVASAF